MLISDNLLYLYTMKLRATLIGLLISLCTLAQNEGNAIFNSSQVHEIHFVFNQTAHWDSLVAGYNNDEYIKCHVIFNGTTMLANSGVKFKGNSSYNNPSIKKSFKIDFDRFVANQEFDGLKKLNLNNGFKDPSFLREKLMLDFLNQQGLPAPRCTYANLYINGELWGLYMLVEEVNNKFLTQRFNDKRGNLFKGDPNGDLRWYGSAPANYYPRYELHTNETINDWSDLIEFINTINNTPAGNFESSLSALFNTDEYINTWAIHGIFANLDSYMGSGHNYYLYHDSITNRFRWISWDVNEAFGNFSMGMNIQQLESLDMFYVPNPPQNRPLNRNILLNNNLKNKLADAYCFYLDNGFAIWNLNNKIDSIADKIRPHVYADTKKFFSNPLFETNIDQDVFPGGVPGGSGLPGIKSFITNRRSQLANQLSAYNCVLSLNERDNKTQSNKVYPNPFNQVLCVESRWVNQSFVLSDLSGRVIAGGIILSECFEPAKNLQPGLYLLSINNQCFRMVKQ
jgi:hypothetical protein